LTENVFKRISAYSNPNPNSHPKANFNPNPKAPKPFRKNEVTSFFGQKSGCFP